MKIESQLLPPLAVKEEEIDPLGGEEELGIFQILDKLEEVTEALLTRWIIFCLKAYLTTLVRLGCQRREDKQLYMF